MTAENAAVKTNNDTASVCHLRKENHRQNVVPKKVYRTCQDPGMHLLPPTLWPCRAGLTTKLFICVMPVYFTSHWLLHLACIAAGLHQMMGGTQATYLLWVKMNSTLFDCNFLCLLTLMMNDYLGWESKNIYIYIYITNCRQYCFGLVGLISAVLMLRWRWSFKSHLEFPTNVVTRSCQSARTRVL